MNAEGRDGRVPPFVSWVPGFGSIAACPANGRRPGSGCRRSCWPREGWPRSVCGGRLPDPRSFLSAFTGADYWWVALAVALQAVSLAAFAWQQSLLLKALGVRLKARHAALVTLARTALSISMPAGGAVSAAYAVREYERAGTPREVGTASMIVSGLASIGGLTLLYVAGFAALVTTDPHLLAGPRPFVVVLVLAALTVSAVLVGRRWMREPSPSPAAAPESGLRGFVRRTLASAREVVYRLISCWLLLPLGGVAAVLLRRRSASSPRLSLARVNRRGAGK